MPFMKPPAVALRALLLGCLTGYGGFALVSATAVPELPEKYRKWLEEDVVYIISDREREAFLELQSVEEWEAFIHAFWRRRDPEPLTPINEFREEHYRRIEFANRTLGRESAVPGWMTDRGKMYIILGEPDDRETFMSVPFLYPAELWFYFADKERGLPPLYLLFFQEHHAGPYRLFNHLLDGPEDLLPAQPLDPQNSRMEAYQLLQDISPALAHSTITLRADEGAYAGIVEPARSSLDFQMLLSDIYESPFRRLDTRWVDAARDARGLVESDYLFNYVPNTGMANVIPGPAGSRFVHYSVEIDPQHMTVAKKEGGSDYFTSFEIRGEVTSRDGNQIIHEFTNEPYLQLTETQFQQVGSRPFAYRGMFPLIEGEFRFRMILKNRARSEYTIFETPLRVPGPSVGQPFLAEPVLLYDMAELSGTEASGAYGTYQLGTVRLNPNPRRVYAIGKTLLAFLPAENLRDEQQIALSLVKQENPAEELVSKTVRVGDYAGAPIIEGLNLFGLAGGRYRLDVELKDPSGKTIQSQSTNFDVSPRSSVPRPWVFRDTYDGENTALVRTALAEQYIRRAQPEQALELCRQALADNPNLVQPRLILARAHLDEKAPVEAIKLLEPARAQNQENVEVLLTLGDAHFQAGSYARAAELFEAAMVLRRPDTALLNALAVCQIQTGQTEKAVQSLNRSLEIDPTQETAKALLESLQQPVSRP
ncbi:MAG: GWxTD domain-containing protein [Acidobacteriota bacterium]